MSRVLASPLFVTVASLVVAVVTPNSVGATKTAALKVPLPQDLCGHRAERRIRRQVNASMKRSLAKDQGSPLGVEKLIACKDGRLRFLRFRVGKERVLMLLMEDRRSVGLNHQVRRHTAAFVGQRSFLYMGALWKHLQKHLGKRELSQATKAKLLVATSMFRGGPTMIFDPRQQKKATKHWPAANRAIALAPPGLRMTGEGLVLQGWLLSSYSNRQTSCNYIKGLRVHFDAKRGPVAVTNHDYAAGTKVGRPCGKPLPSATGAAGLTVPMPKDLCAHPAQKRIRRRLSAIMKRSMAKGLGAPMGRATLVPCQHGRLRFLRFSIGKRRILALVEEDQRPSYISGPSRKSGYVFVGRRFFFDMGAVWKALGKSARRLDEEAKAKLLVTAMMLRREPTMVFDKRQGDAATKHWPAARRAMALAPPGLTKSKGGLVLRAWTLSSYNERGVSCRYIKGWEVRLDDKSGPKVTRTHSYAAGRRRGRSCGKPLPRP